jgi:hypothetical protein
VAKEACQNGNWRRTDEVIEGGMFAFGTDMPKYLGDLRCWANSGKHLLSLSFSAFDPIRTLGLSDLRAASVKLAVS